MSNEQRLFKGSALFKTFAQTAAEMMLMINHHYDRSL